MSDRLTVDGDVISQRAGLQSGLTTNFQFQAGDGSFLYSNQNEVNGFSRRNKSWNRLSGDWKNNFPYVKMGNNVQAQLAIKNPNVSSVLLDSTNYPVSLNADIIRNDIGYVRVINNRIGCTISGVNIDGFSVIYAGFGANFPIEGGLGLTGYFFRDFSKGSLPGNPAYQTFGSGAANFNIFFINVGAAGAFFSGIAGVDNSTFSPRIGTIPGQYATITLS
jgi:hypothetical protein